MAARRGRPVLGVELVDVVAGSEDARLRLKLILETLGGASTIEQACRQLGIGRSMFNKLRSQFLASAAGLLEPRQPGRKKRLPTPAEQELEHLRQENQELKLQLKTRQIREEIALVMPHLLKDRAGKKTAGRSTPRR